jgi:predicted nucleic acid-binding protein
VYVLDSDVLTIVSGSRRNDHVTRWYESVDETDIYLSVIGILEMRRSAEMRRHKHKIADAERIEGRLGEIIRFFGNRILPIDTRASQEWARLLVPSTNRTFDKGVGAVAKSRDFTIVTRNTKDFVGRGIRVLNPYSDPATVQGP